MFREILTRLQELQSTVSSEAAPVEDAETLRRRIAADAGVPARYLDAALSEHRDLLQYSQQFCKGSSLFISGPVGPGKTHYAAALLNNAVRHVQAVLRQRFQSEPTYSDILVYGQRVPVMVSAPAFISMLKEGFDRQDGYGDYLTGMYRDIPRLIVDGLGDAADGEWAQGVWFRMLDARYTGMRQTVITSNLTLSEVDQLYGERLASRLAEMCTVVKMSGADRRVENALSRKG